GLLAVAAIPPLAGLTGDAFHSPAVFTAGFRTTMLAAAAMMAAAAVTTFLTIRQNVLATAPAPHPSCPVEAPQLGER
ncbi:MFS transporter, partial [Streptosporangium algeriense]